MMDERFHIVEARKVAARTIKNYYDGVIGDKTELQLTNVLPDLCPNLTDEEAARIAKEVVREHREKMIENVAAP